jgi:CBS domain-containing protein
MLADPVAKFMTPDVTTVAPDTTVGAALDLLLERRISGVPVVDEAGRVVGIFSVTDAARAVAESPHKDDEDSFYQPMALLQFMSQKRKPEATELLVGAVMSRNLRATYTDTTMAEAAKVMADFGIHRLVVLDREHHLAGMLSALDVCRAVGGA